MGKLRVNARQGDSEYVQSILPGFEHLLAKGWNIRVGPKVVRLTRREKRPTILVSRSTDRGGDEPA